MHIHSLWANEMNQEFPKVRWQVAYRSPFPSKMGSQTVVSERIEASRLVNLFLADLFFWPLRLSLLDLTFRISRVNRNTGEPLSWSGTCRHDIPKENELVLQNLTEHGKLLLIWNLQWQGNQPPISKSTMTTLSPRLPGDKEHKEPLRMS